MLAILLISFLGFGLVNGNIFESDFKNLRLKPLRGDVQKFSVDKPNHLADGWKVSDKANDLMSKIRSSVLLRGTPLEEFQDQRTLPLFPLLPARKAKLGSSGPRVNLKTFDISNCSQSAAQKSTFVVRQINITPNNPVQIPGSLTFSFDINVLKDINTLSVQVLMMYKSQGTFIKVPCLADIGSCTYDVCDLLTNVQQCPDELQKHNINCQCPFNKGTYTEPGFTTDIDADVFPTGEYFVNATMTSGGDFVGCYTADFTLEAE